MANKSDRPQNLNEQINKLIEYLEHGVNEGDDSNGSPEPELPIYEEETPKEVKKDPYGVLKQTVEEQKAKVRAKENVNPADNYGRNIIIALIAVLLALLVIGIAATLFVLFF